MINTVSWRKLKVARYEGIHFPGMVDHGVAERFWNIISLCFLAEERVLQICHWVYGRKFYSNSVDDITTKCKFKLNWIKNFN